MCVTYATYVIIYHDHNCILVDVLRNAVCIVQLSLQIIYIQMRNNLFPKTDKIYVLCNITMKITLWQFLQRKQKTESNRPMDRNRFSFMMWLSYFQTTITQLGFLRLKSECKMTMIDGNCRIQTITTPVRVPAAIQPTTKYDVGYKQTS